MENAAAPLADMLMHLVLFFLEVAVLRKVLHLLARHAADTGFGKGVLVTALIAGTYGYVNYATRAPFGPLTLLATFVVGLFATRFLCWLTWKPAVYVTLATSPLFVGMNVGAVRAADHIAPNRTTFMNAMVGAESGMARWRSLPDQPMNWEQLFARILDSVAKFTAPKETASMTKDIGKGMEWYRERKAERLKEGPIANAGDQATMLVAMRELATGGVGVVRMDAAALGGFGDVASTSAPQDVSASLSQIRSNLSGEGLASFQAMMRTGMLSMAELIRDARTYQGTNNEAMIQAMRLTAQVAMSVANADPTQRMGALGTSGSVTVATGAVPAHVMAAWIDSALHGGTNGLAGASGTVASAAGAVPPEVLGAWTQCGLLGGTNGLAGTNAGPAAAMGWLTAVTKADSGATGKWSAVPGGGGTGQLAAAPADAGETPAPYVPPESRHPSREKLKVAGVIAGRDGRVSVLCNGALISTGQTVTVTMDNASYTWLLSAVTNGKPVWQRVYGAGARAPAGPGQKDHAGL